nr:MAG TPA_asm: hypothetical protein [Bacteriophage sp.]
MSAEASMYKPSLQGAVNTATPYTTLLKQPLTGALKYSSIMAGAGKEAVKSSLDASAKTMMNNAFKATVNNTIDNAPWSAITAGAQ